MSYSAGKLIAEYSSAQQTQPSVNYTTTDHLGSPRVITNELGHVRSRRDFMPFGEELSPAVGSRSSTPEYFSGDNVRQKFTGYQKDEETGLDFAEARMYENRHGRFTAVDPLLGSGRSPNPQTFNRYVYVGNRPLRWVDPSGEDWVVRLEKREFVVNGVKVTKEVRVPVWVPEASESDEIAPFIWQVTNPLEQTGFQALHPDTSETSAIFATQQAAEEKFTEWVVAQATSGEVSLGNGWTGRIDPYNGGEGFEIHVRDKSGNERGIVSGRNGWIGKHGHAAEPPADIPRTTLNRINGLNVNELRKRGLIGAKGTQVVKAGRYLNAGRRLYGGIRILGLAQGVMADYALYKRAQQNGRTFTEQQAIELSEQDEYTDSIIGPLPNPYYNRRIH